jgi:hypothetical protein
MLALDDVIAASKQADVLADVSNIKQAALHTVVEVCGEVGDLVGEVYELRFKRWSKAEEVVGEPGVFAPLVVTRVLDDALTGTEREVQAAMAGVALLKAVDDAERMEIMVKAQTVALQADIESTFAGMAKGRMPDVMHQRERLGEIHVEAECSGDLASDLSDLNGVRKAAAKVVRGAAGEDLCLASETAEGARLNDAVAVTLKGCASVAGGRGKFTDREQTFFVTEDSAGMEVSNHELRV